ncbi:MAG: cytochrome c3 family protein [Coriobacteriia bacterium]|nr:cytochrome c3 family protein [Coriobacteriia bacterium]
MATSSAIIVVSLVSVAAAAESPHGDYSSDPDLSRCGTCHVPHQASVSRGLLSVDSTSTVVTQTLFCFKCHADAGPAESNAAATFESGFLSGHAVEDVAEDEGPDLTNTCSGCHDAHSSAPGLPRSEINGQEVSRTAEPNSWCLACHTPELATNWSGLVGDGYYDLLYESSSRDARGYPMTGTFRGAAAYAASAHASIPASDSVVIQAAPERTAARVVGDCLWCHASHRGVSEYDNLLDTFGPSAPGDPGADACFGCHEAGEGYGTGHFISSADSVLQAGSPLPCYECHNAHGSKNGNALLIQDSLGSNLDPGTPAGQSAFCYSCHLSSDGFWWDSASGTMRPASELASAGASVTKVITGIARADMVQLPPTVPQHESDTLEGCSCHGSPHSPNPAGVSAGGQRCYDCHGGYRDAMESDGDQRQDSYHHVLGGAYRGDHAFDSEPYPGAGTTPLADTEVYCLSCHVDHDQFYDGKDGGPTSKGANLRQSIDDAVPADTDYVASTGGICLGCHDVVRAKDTDNRASADGTEFTPAIDPDTYGGSAHGVKTDGTTLYTVESAPFSDGSSTFQANCAKCHNDNRARDYYDSASSAPTFGLHWNSSRRILAALGRGDAASDPYTEERFCYSCHSPSAAGFKAAADRDWYQTPGVTMSAASQGVYTQFANNNAARRSHRVSRSWAGLHAPSVLDETGAVGGVTRFTAGEHVECTDCHSPHAAGAAAVSGTKRSSTVAPSNSIADVSPLAGVWGVSIVPTAEWTEPTYAVVDGAQAEYQICLKCHTGFNSSYTPDGAANRSSGTFSWSTAAAWTNVALEFNPANDSYHPVFAKARRPLRTAQTMTGPWNSYKGNQTMYCSDCHMDSAVTPVAMGPHGSATTRILRGNWNPTSNAAGYTLNSTAGLLCAKCHTNLATSNIAHSNHANRGYSCGKCHIAIPHGGAAPRLLATTGTTGGRPTPAPYNAGTQLVNFYLSPTTGIGGSGRTNATCQVTSSPINCGAHNGTAQTMYWDW